MELAAASDSSERLQLENAALQDRVAALEGDLQDAQRTLFKPPATHHTAVFNSKKDVLAPSCRAQS